MNLRPAVQPKETKEFEGFTRTRTLTCRANGGCLRTSEVRLRQVLFNVVGHALKFRGKGHVTIRAGTGARTPSSAAPQNREKRLDYSETPRSVAPAAGEGARALVSQFFSLSESDQSLLTSAPTEHETDERKITLVLEVEGPGLSDEYQTKLFGKFARLSAKPTGGEPATGLDLSIVERMVEAMNGQVWCESQAGQGAQFIVQFPAEPA